MKGLRILMAYLHPGTVRAEFMDAVLQTREATAKAGVEWYSISARSGADITRARNSVFRAAAATEPHPHYVWMVDADMVFTDDTVRALVSEEVSDGTIRSGLCVGQNADGTLFPAFRMFKADGKTLRPGDWADIREAQLSGKRYLPVAAVGMACTVIPWKVVETLAGVDDVLWPFSEQTWPDTMRYGTTEDDVTFCLRAKHMGFEVLVDLLAPVGHVKDRVLFP